MIRLAKPLDVPIIQDWLYETAHLLKEKKIKQWDFYLEKNNTSVIKIDYFKH